MKIITIKQPWATLIAEGYKKYEFRSWKTKYKGPLLIHAGKGVDKDALKDYARLNLIYPTSQIVALVNLDECILIDDKFNNKISNDIYGYHDRIGLYAWKLSNVKKLNDDRYIKGQLGLWNIENIKSLE